jgi:hypothetical protein
MEYPIGAKRTDSGKHDHKRGRLFDIRTMNILFASKLTILLLIITGGGLTHSYAQSGRYNGPGIALERIRQEPPQYSECNRPSQKTGREAMACNFGVEEARRMAMRYGGGYGRMHGYLRGFSWGLYRMSNLTANDASAMNQGALAVNGMGSYINSGVQLGQQQGEKQGRDAGFNMAVNRFVSAVDTGRFPSSQFNMPLASYAGEDNGYERYVDRNGARSPQQILREDLGHMNSSMRAYDNLDNVFIDNVPRISLWDAWHADGIYRFETGQWLDADLALKVWLKRPIDTKSRFNELNKPPLTEPVLDREGKPIIENGAPKTRNIDLQQVFKSAFVNAYRHYAQYYCSHELYRALDEGQMQGELVGIELGKRIAYQKGLIEAFNAKFKESSRQAFRSAYENAFQSSFTTTFNDYADNAKLDIEFTDVIGREDDGIIQPGEAVAVSFKVRNSGGRATSIRATLGGDVIEPQLLALGNMPALATKEFKTSAIAAINPNLHTGTNANLLLKVNDKEIPHAEKVMTPIQIAGQRNVVETRTGAARAFIAVQNITTLRSAGNVKVALALHGKTLERILGMAEAGQIKEAEFDISALDPLDLIKGIDAQIQVTMGDRFMSDGRLKLISADVKLELAAYFDQLIKGQGLVPSTIRLEDRIAAVRKMIADKNLAEVSEDIKGNPWKDNGLSTMLGLLVHNLKSMDQPSAAKKIYAKLGQDLWEHRKKLGQVLFFKSGNRKQYESLCKELMQ